MGIVTRGLPMRKDENQLILRLRLRDMTIDV